MQSFSEAGDGLRRLGDETIRKVEAAIAAHSADFGRVRNFLGAEAGFPVVNGRLIRDPAIIAYVSEKLPPSRLLPEDRLPRRLAGFRVDVVEADIDKQLELTPLGRALSARMESAALAGPTYEGLPGDPIDEVFTVVRPILCHVGPDTGWTTLRRFVEATRDRLTVAMYDFNADYIAASLLQTFRGNGGAIDLTLDDRVEEDEGDIQEQLAMALEGRYSRSIVRCGGGRRFPSAYHPKVAVQDGRRFWLSSGNWSRRSQPEIDPLGDPQTAKGMYGRGNREWHVVVDDEPLARLFERYILHDKAQADEDAALGTEIAPPMPDLFVPIDDLLAERETAALAAPDPVAPAALPRKPRPVAVRPLLSPDNYARRIAEWALAAEESLLLQYSYITYSTAPKDKAFRTFLDALGELSWKEGFDLRIIMSSKQGEKARLLAQNGFNEKAVRLQSEVHNKGIVRDGAAVLISSQNWSGDGFLRNRDAGLVIEDREIAAYFAEVFEDDWRDRARDPFAVPGASAKIAPLGASPPPGTVRMRWADFFGE